MKKNIFSYRQVLSRAFYFFILLVVCVPIFTHAQATRGNPDIGDTTQTTTGYTTSGGNPTAVNPVPPTVTTMTAIESVNSASLEGYFSGSDTDPTYTEFLWGTDPNSLSNSTGFVQQSSSAGNFSADISGLAASTQYYYQAVAKNQLGGVSAQAQIMTFTTDDAVQTAPCSVTSFTTSATNNTINQWNTTTLYWTSSNCTSLTLSSSDGKFSNTSVIKKSYIPTGSLGSTTSYVLIGTDVAGNISQLNLTINVTPLDSIDNTGDTGNTGNTGYVSSTPCQIYSFSVNGSSYAQVDYNDGATLSWNTSTGCTNIKILGDNGTKFENNANQSTLYLSPFKHQVIYTLSAEDANGIGNTQQVTVTVNNATITNNASGNCNITAFNSSSQSVASGQTITLYWSTSGSCTSVTITGTSDSIPFKYSLPANGSVATNPLYGTSTFNITANGNVSTNGAPVTVYVTGGPYPYDSSGQATGTNVITSVATNVGAYSVRLNGVFVGTLDPTTAWFEYGTDTSVTATTNPQDFAAGVTRAYYDTIITNPKTTYYYRAVTKVDGVISKGSIMSVITKDAGDTTIYAQTTSNASSTTVAPAAGVTLSITNKGDKVYVGDTVDFTIAYANGTDKKLSNVGINITLPQGFTLIQSTKGQTISPTMVSVNVGTLAPGQSDTIFLQAKVNSNVSLTNTLVTNGTMSFTYPNGSNDSTVGYVLNHAGGVAALGGFTLGAGFFPTTILGWIITILIILAVILTIRRITKAKHGTGAVHH